MKHHGGYRGRQVGNQTIEGIEHRARDNEFYFEDARGSLL